MVVCGHYLHQYTTFLYELDIGLLNSHAQHQHFYHIMKAHLIEAGVSCVVQKMSVIHV